MSNGFFIKVNKLALKLISTCRLIAFLKKNIRRRVLSNIGQTQLQLPVFALT